MDAPGFPIAHGVVASPVRVSRMISATPCAVISTPRKISRFPLHIFIAEIFSLLFQEPIFAILSVELIIKSVIL